VLLAQSGQLQRAIDEFSTAVRYEPNYVEARLLLAEALARSGQFDKSLPHYQQVLAINPQSANAQFGYAMVLAGLHRYAEARKVLSEAARLHPDQPRFADALARLR
jgi:tetratricopeptide (TPR) repeat protein